MQQVILSDHAVVKLQERGILKQKVIQTIVAPDFVQNTYRMREERYRNFRKNYLKVVGTVRGELFIVITAHWVAKIKKTW